MTDTTTPLTWGGLTAEMQKRLVEVSRGDYDAPDDKTSGALYKLGLLEQYCDDRDNCIEHLTPLGGDLLRQRDEVLIDFIQAVLADEMGSGDGDKVAGMNALADKWGLPDEHRGDCYQDLIIAMAQAALAQVQEGGEHE